MMPGKKSRIIIDTNIWISFLIGKKLKTILSLLIDEKVTLVFSDPLLKEIQVVTQREKLKRYFDPVKVTELIDLLLVVAEWVAIKNEDDICRDPKDNFLLAMAKVAKADYLITGDSDLLVLKKYQKTKIITVSQFEKLIK